MFRNGCYIITVCYSWLQSINNLSEKGLLWMDHHDNGFIWMNVEEKLLSSTNIDISVHWWVRKCCAVQWGQSHLQSKHTFTVMMTLDDQTNNHQKHYIHPSADVQRTLHTFSQASTIIKHFIIAEIMEHNCESGSCLWCLVGDFKALLLRCALNTILCAFWKQTHY